MPQTIKIQQEPGFYLDRDRATLPEVPGIYVVYKCDYDAFHDRVDVKEPLYIGESQNIRESHNGTPDHPAKHEHYDDFVKEAGGEGHICYGIVPMPEFTDADRKRIQAAMIFSEKPSLNEAEAKDNYSQADIHLLIEGFPNCWKHPRISILGS